jgi:hypothetical protein
MRLMTLGVGIAAVLVTSAAWAAPQGGASGDKGNTGGKGGEPVDTNAATSVNNPEATTPQDQTQIQLGKQANPDQATQTSPTKSWQISADFGTYHLLRDQYVASAQSTTANIADFGASYQLTEHDLLSLGGGFIQYLQADPGESGFRAFDLALSYTRFIPLPGKVNLGLTGSLTAPISYESQLASNITTPSITVSVSRTFGDLYLRAFARGTVFWDRYSSTPGLTSTQGENGDGQMNPQWAFTMGVSAEYTMPFHRPLSIGAQVATYYTWYYNTGNMCPQGGGLSESGIPNETSCPGFTTNNVTDGNPTQQAYGESIYARYILPDLGGFKSDFSVGLGNGGGPAGNPSVLQDGVTHLYLFEYNSTQVYATVEGRY